jgi:hypothetical protein
MPYEKSRFRLTLEVEMLDITNPVGSKKAFESLLGLRLRSRVYGRERWEVPAILGNKRAAASVKTLLQSESGVRCVVANDTTGRVLIEYAPSELNDSIEVLLQRALEFGPMSASEFAALRDSRPSRLSVFAPFGAAHLGCLFLKLLPFGVSCPAFGAAIAVLGLATVSLLQTRSSPVIPIPSPAHRIESDEASGISDDQNRAEVMQNRRDDRVNGPHGREIKTN